MAVGEAQSSLGILARWAKRNLVYDPFCHNAIRTKVLAAGTASSLMLTTNRPTTDFAYRPGLLLTKRTLLSIVPDHLSRSRLKDLSIGLARSKHLYGHYGNMEQLNHSYSCINMTANDVLSPRSNHVLGYPCRRDGNSVLHLKFRRQLRHGTR